MAKSDRTAQLTKLQKVVKKHYDPVLPLVDRSVLEHLLFGLCLENSAYDKAEEAFARLQLYDDWNEVRVTSETELSEAMSALGDPAGAASRIKGVLQGVFEQGLFDQKYDFNIDHLRKQNIGKAIKELEKFPSLSPFALAYVTQAALGGHAIPLDKGTLDALLVVDVIGEKDHEKQHVPGLERTIPKTKGAEFASLLHQLGADFYNSPHSPRVRSLLLEISPDCKDRLPKRSSKEDAEAAPSTKAEGASGSEKSKAKAERASKSEPKAQTRKKAATPKASSETGKVAKGATKRKPR